ncbi:hypothetical protein DVH05_002651 [Phytophthora capsici]|uniref:RxLR effector protein n=1 Tax=Phytophthora capsici TaxID=4784 RepID=T2FGL8_PHYCP|nr:RXLR effector [Phytophthora capsici]KAG1706089.1 hypothetical protein DVH05_002650 [Phytophthora capsici]KAG1706090.1 hypothetical protein DVH05_002651 [Phytophthora capsici]
MRLTCILLVAAASLVGVLDASAATTGNTVVANAAMVISPLAPESQGRRSLRLVYDDEDDSADEKDDEEEDSADKVDEERGWLSDKMALTSLASKFVGKSTDEMGEVIKKLTPAQIDTIFDKGEDSIQKMLPGFYSGMDFQKFDDLIRALPQEQQAVMLSAYTKYLHQNGRFS